MSEMDFEAKFVEKYFNEKLCEYNALNEVDLLLRDKKNNIMLYIEAKENIENDLARQKALAQLILTNKKQNKILSRVALIYKDNENNDIFELIDCRDNSVMYNNDINWKAEKPSNPTRDAIDRINDRIKDRIKIYKNAEIKEIYEILLSGKEDINIYITMSNFIAIYNEWKNEISFDYEVKNEQELINLFLVDTLNGAKYENDIKSGNFAGTEKALIREGVNLNNYNFTYSESGKKDGIRYGREYYGFKNVEAHENFWKKYKRPPEKEDFEEILEHSSKLYSDQYRRDTGGEYTPFCFVEKQNRILRRYYNLDDFIVFDPCAGVGNLENQFGKEFKQNCYLSTLEQMDVDICKIKGFENAVQFDYLGTSAKNKSIYPVGEPKFKYKGYKKTINEICYFEKKKLMVVMNPPYQRQKGKKNNLAIEFFNKVVNLNPQVIVFYYMTESFLRDEINHYIKSGYKIVSHIFSNAKTTFNLSEWSISQIIFDKDKGREIDPDIIKATRYEYDSKKNKLKRIKTYTYNMKKPSLIDNIKNLITKNNNGIKLGSYTFANGILLGNGKLGNITSNNLKYCLLAKGIFCNTHDRYFERNQYVFRGNFNKISNELFADAIAFALFYKKCNFSNKGQKNYIIPFSSKELNCNKNDLNVLFAKNTNANLDENPYIQFDFREFLKQFEFSKEAKRLFSAALEIFKYYHKNKRFENKNFNDSFYDITNAIMEKDPKNDFKNMQKENDYRIYKTKTTKGTSGFSKNTIKYKVESEHLPIFIEFFNARDELAQKINKELIESGLLLWERENIY